MNRVSSENKYHITNYANQMTNYEKFTEMKNI